MTSRGYGLADAHGGLLHTAPVTAIGLLVLNDHVLKAMAPGPITGVLSDLAGLAFFPLLLVAFVELFRLALGRAPEPDETTKALAFLSAGEAETSLVHFCHALLNLNEFVYLP